ncbi:DNA repair protein RecO [Candidatus Saccharibacteria bacterium]|nr:DNA repair protein RecO [Candidatus Saccharibacteria bacterium]
MKKTENDIKTMCYVLRRTNYAEADRILNLITPVGKLSVMAKGVRKAKSKLAGGVEMFTKSEVMIHRGRSELGTLTGVKMVRYCGNIVKDLSRMELAAMMLRRVNIMAEGADAEEYFKIVDAGLTALDDGVDAGLTEAWFLLNLMRVSGEEINLYRNVDGELLVANERYAWDGVERAFSRYADGEYGAAEIKMMRLMVTSDLAMTTRVKNAATMVPRILQLARSVVK